MTRKTTLEQASESVPSAPSGQLGARVLHARLVKGMTLKEVAALAQCSESSVSKIERNLASPSLAMLHRLAHALNTNVSELTADKWPNTGPVLKAGERFVHSFGHGTEHRGIELETISTAVKGSLLQANIHILQPGAKSDGQIEHVGEEVGYVLEGSVILLLGKERYELNAGDAFHFSSHTAHGYENTGTHIARILWVNTPATF
ncbi:cupin domain-containing protein [Undibacterium sp. TJN25]|uniref:cupin domain-containing protein n=1 Tax=Undibacterium sp. TJN25 TaxID=3413056 RepID=UPI003BF37E77